MLLYIIVKSNERNDVIRSNYLVYIDESYDGHGSDLSIDTYDISRKPFSGNWKFQAQNMTGTVYTSSKNLTRGKTYKVAIVARVNGKWDTANAIKNAVTVTVK